MKLINYIQISIYIFALHLLGHAQSRKNDMSLVRFDVREYQFNNANIESKLKESIFGAPGDSLEYFFKKYTIFNMNIVNDTGSMMIKLSLSCCSYKYESVNLFGYFVLNDYSVFIHNSIPDFLNATANYKTFAYEKYLDEPFFWLWEDDVPFWIFRYNGSELSKTHDPIVADRYFKELYRVRRKMHRSVRKSAF